MANKNDKKDLTPVTLVAEHMFSPYRAGDVFTLPRYQADKVLQADSNVDDENNSKVVEFDKSNSKHVALLAQYGEKLDDKGNIVPANEPATEPNASAPSKPAQDQLDQTKK